MYHWSCRIDAYWCQGCHINCDSTIDVRKAHRGAVAMTFDGELASRRRRNYCNGLSDIVCCCRIYNAGRLQERLLKRPVRTFGIVVACISLIRDFITENLTKTSTLWEVSNLALTVCREVEYIRKYLVVTSEPLRRLLTGLIIFSYCNVTLGVIIKYRVFVKVYEHESSGKMNRETYATSLDCSCRLLCRLWMEHEKHLRPDLVRLYGKCVPSIRAGSGHPCMQSPEDFLQADLDIWCLRCIN